MYILVMFTEHVYIQDPRLMKALVTLCSNKIHIAHNINAELYVQVNTAGHCSQGHCKI